MEKIKLLLYCTKGKPLLYKGITAYTRSVEYVLDKEQYLFGKIETLNGKIVAECDFEVEEIRPFFHWCKDLENETCLSQEEVLDYLDSKDKSVGNPKRQKSVNLIHIKNLHIFDEPRELSDYCLYPKNIKGVIHFVLEGTPYIVLSVSPQEMCRLLNGEQTILVRKKY